MRWTATRCFAQARRIPRVSAIPPRPRRELCVAERHFYEAASEDHEFDLAYHNLGVVLIERNMLSAAERAFEEAIRINPGRVEPYYGVAVIDFACGGDHGATCAACGS